ncbi:rhodanese-like domain-containing protein [Actinocatenispora sera]|uniref:Rhodanese domain-containing protein n=1 Tax=Actinocatenispora sera TaxID=390989 RepID=A0A810L3D9_9ACTN|nr:rhodanese-like domain-containing protein [Actinocatenispora sera]BCJ30070.1 hypothetical protein Asera_41780 [Actinocatenispora sera]
MPAGSAEEIDVEVAAAAWAAGDLVLDVRTPEEYANGHVAGARNVPLSRLPAAARELPPGQLITVCTSGGPVLAGGAAARRPRPYRAVGARWHQGLARRRPPRGRRPAARWRRPSGAAAPAAVPPPSLSGGHRA